ncbi:hypothetical protein [Kitasatospora sp. NPDC059803]|uniref:hypothetical protein n=1 Tax=Kitasatospora sp. NPDC059803 TaxID=3346953 RepID=UPI00365DDE9A
MDGSVEKPAAVGAGARPGTPGTVLMVVRGPSGAGKSSTATRIRSAYGRGLAIVGQDLLRVKCCASGTLPAARTSP